VGVVAWASSLTPGVTAPCTQAAQGVGGGTAAGGQDGGGRPQQTRYEQHARPTRAMAMTLAWMLLSPAAPAGALPSRSLLDDDPDDGFTDFSAGPSVNNPGSAAPPPAALAPGPAGAVDPALMAVFAAQVCAGMAAALSCDAR
jgi:hypothetical protein